MNPPASRTLQQSLLQLIQPLQIVVTQQDQMVIPPDLLLRRVEVTEDHHLTVQIATLLRADMPTILKAIINTAIMIPHQRTPRALITKITTPPLTETPQEVILQEIQITRMIAIHQKEEKVAKTMRTTLPLTETLDRTILQKTRKIMTETTIHQAEVLRRAILRETQTTKMIVIRQEEEKAAQTTVMTRMILLPTEVLDQTVLQRTQGIMTETTNHPAEILQGAILRGIQEVRTTITHLKGVTPTIPRGTTSTVIPTETTITHQIEAVPPEVPRQEEVTQAL